MIKYNVFSFFNSGVPCLIYQENEKNVISRFIVPNSLNISASTSISDFLVSNAITSTNFNDLINFLNYNLEPLQNSLNKLISLFGKLTDTNSQSDKIKNIIFTIKQQFKELHPYLDKYSFLYICYIVLENRLPYLAINSHEDLYSIISDICDIIYTLGFKTPDIYPNYKLPKSPFERLEDDIVDMCQKNESLIISNIHSSKMSDTFQDFINKICTKCFNAFFVYPSNQAPITDAFYKKLQNCVQDNFINIAFPITTHTYQAIASTIKKICEDIIPVRDFSKNYIFSESTAPFPFLSHVKEAFCYYFSEYAYNSPVTKIHYKNKNGTIQFTNIPHICRSLNSIIQFRNDIVQYMPDKITDNSKSDLLNYFRLLYNKYGYNFRAPFYAPFFFTQATITPPEDSKTLSEQLNSYSYQTAFENQFGRAEKTLNQSDNLLKFYQDSPNIYFIYSFSQYILSDLDALFHHKKLLYLSPNGQVVLEKPQDTPELYQKMTKKLRVIQSQSISAKNKTSLPEYITDPAFLSETEYLHKAIYRFAVYHHFSSEEYDKLINSKDYTFLGLSNLMSSYNYNCESLWSDIKEISS